MLLNVTIIDPLHVITGPVNNFLSTHDHINIEILNQMDDNIDAHVVHKRAIKLSKKDIVVAGCMLTSILVVWIRMASEGRFKCIMSYCDSFEYIFVAQHFYKAPEGDYSMIGNRVINSTSLCRVLPAVPVILKALNVACFGNWTLASAIFILVTALLSSILFHRFLKTWRVVKNPTTTACLFSLFPIRHLACHCVVNSDSLFLCCVFLCLIGYKRNSMKMVMSSLALAVMTHTQGIVLTLSMLLLYTIRDKNQETTATGITAFSSYMLVMLLQKLRTGSLWAFWIERFVRSKQFSVFPFASAFLNAMSISTLREFHTLYGLHIPGLIGVAMMFNSNIDLSLFSMMFLLYVLMLNYGDIFHEGITYEILTVLVGLDIFISNPKFNKILPVFIIIYGIAVFTLTQRGVMSIFDQSAEKFELLKIV